MFTLPGRDRPRSRWRALARNRLRTGLTTLGIVIGVAAVIAMVALGNGARASVERTLRSAGTSIVQVTAGNYIRGGESVNIASGLGAATTLTRGRRRGHRSARPMSSTWRPSCRSRTWVASPPIARIFAARARHGSRPLPRSTAGRS